MFDLDLVTRRLAELRIGEVEFRTRTGISLDVLRKDPAPATISVDVVVRICELLDIEVAAFLGRESSARVSYPDDDDLVVEAALAQHGQLADGDLAVALDWPLRRVDEAVRALMLRLLGTALQVVREGNRVHLEPRPGLLGAETDDRLRALQQAQIPLSVREAVILLHLLHQRHDPLLERLPLDWETTEVLLHRGIAERDTSGLHPHLDSSFAVALYPLPQLPQQMKAKPGARASYSTIPRPLKRRR
ncbi:hypothetical protein FE391_42585 [Nonomuraea sp. KC401]|uniref:hypothetical protein n=1 Tax=unclassified Nonomuraea TaxID=2593643 RepID=UPI0010FDEADD|nr:MULTISPECIES: hypothetical protein [unclassified Nonomuraea]NBF00101.1 hypothetical protein [Nonomuraea sp. K271]TLF53946.1 hypothetical protein FE391_42585 [Nonomuraea sp. KC401]